MCIYSSYDEEISTSEIKTIRVNSISNDFELPNDILYIFHKIKNVSSCIHLIFGQIKASPSWTVQHIMCCITTSFSGIHFKAFSSDKDSLLATYWVTQDSKLGQPDNQHKQRNKHQF